MNASQARQIPVGLVAEMLGGKYSHQAGGYKWYFSPFNPKQETASFKENPQQNTWIDFSVSSQRPGKDHAGGSSIDLWLYYHKEPLNDPGAFKRALSGLSGIQGYTPTGHTLFTHTDRQQTAAAMQSHDPERYKLKKQPTRIWMDSLKRELERRKISEEVAAQCGIKQAWITDTEKKRDYNGFAFENDKGGWDISIPNSNGKSFKTVIGAKAITTLGPNSNAFLVFEGFFDFAAWQVIRGGREPEGKVFILNSVTMARSLAENIADNQAFYTMGALFLDNDEAGQSATQVFLKTLEDRKTHLKIGTLNELYASYKDVNDLLIANPSYRITEYTSKKTMNDTAWSNLEKVQIAANGMKPKF